jgi:hypothetical protein
VGNEEKNEKEFSCRFSMADLYGTAPSSVAPESEEISTFMNQFLHHNSSSSMSSCMTYKTKHMHFQQSLPSQSMFLQSPEAATSSTGLFSVKDCRRLSRSADRSETEFRFREGNSRAAVESSYGVDFSDRGGYFPADVKESNKKTFTSSAGVLDSDRRISSENNLGDFSCDSEVLFILFLFFIFSEFCLVAEKIGGEEGKNELFEG